MFGFNKIKRIAKAGKEIQEAIVLQSYIFAHSVGEEVDARLLEIDSDAPQYHRLTLPTDKNYTTLTYINQISFSREAMAFYLNILARTCYTTSKREAAGERVLKPAILELLDLFAKSACALTGGDLAEHKRDIEELFWRRESQYSRRRSAFGVDLDDQSSAFSEAKKAIATEAQPDLDEYLVPLLHRLAMPFLEGVVGTALLRGIKDMDLKKRVDLILPDLP